MDKTDKIFYTAFIAPFAGALFGGLRCAVFGISLIFRTDYGLKGFAAGAIVGFIVTVAAEIAIAVCACLWRSLKKLFPNRK